VYESDSHSGAGGKKSKVLLRVHGTSRHYHNEICVGAHLSAQAVIGYDE
jgi:hypothetical protein